MLKKYFFLISILILSQFKIFAQRDNKWLFGYASFGGFPYGNVDMDFSQSNLDSIYFHYRNMNFEDANSSICDISGNLLFYTNGVYIANALDDTMLNGTGLNPSFYTTDWYEYGLNIPQANIIVPKPGNDSLYYLFHETIDIGGIYVPSHLYYSIINLNGDSGKGEVILKNNAIINDTLATGSITACKHANGRDWWVVVPSYGLQAGLYLVLVTPDTVQVYSHQTFPIDGTQGGQACFSTDGNKYVWNNWFGMTFFDFDRCTGSFTLEDDTVFADGIGWFGTSISPNSRYCYLSHGLYLFQYDLQATDISSSLITIAAWDSFMDPFPTPFWVHQLAPDGKIYLNEGNGNFSLHCINQPDSAGIACNFLQHSINLQRYNVTIPNFPNYNLGRLVGSPCDTLQWAGVTEEEQWNFRFSVLPNPNDGNFKISYSSTTSTTSTSSVAGVAGASVFQIIDVTGKTVYKQNLPQWSTLQNISLPHLADGVYSCVINCDGRRVGRRMVVIR